MSVDPPTGEEYAAEFAEAAEDARQGLEDAARIGRAVVAEERRRQGLERALGLAPANSGPRTGGVLPSPGHEATRAREEVAALEKRVGEMEGAHNRIVQRVHDAEDEQGRLEARVEVLEKVRLDHADLNIRILDSLVDLRVRVSSLENPATRREDAVFAAGYRAGHWDANSHNVTAFQSEVDAAHARWVKGGRKTHLGEAGE